MKFLKLFTGSLMAFILLACGEESAALPNQEAAPDEVVSENQGSSTDWPALQALLAENLFNPPPEPLGPDEVPPISTLSLQGQDVQLSGLPGQGGCP
jgi:hypothetical protein